MVLHDEGLVCVFLLGSCLVCLVEVLLSFMSLSSYYLAVKVMLLDKYRN